MLTIVLCCFVLEAMIYLVGRLILNRKFFRLVLIKDVPEWYEYFWVGLVLVIGILQIWSIFFPVNIFSLAFVFALAMVSLFILIKNGIKFPKFGHIWRWLTDNIGLVTLSILVLLAISYFASFPVGWGDSHLYHLNAVKWSNLYKIVPGLTNLHSRLGLNSSLFLFASMIDNWFLKDRSSHVALSLITSVLSLEFIWIFYKSGKTINKIFLLFVLPLLICSIIRRTIVASLSPDFALIVIVFAICIEFLKGNKGSLLIAGLLSLLLFTIKLSGLSFAILIIIIVVLKSKDWRTFLFFLISGILIFLPYIVRNIFLSGWPFYPLAIFKFNVPWAVSRENVIGMYNVIQAWARVPGDEWAKFVGVPFWQWFLRWYARNNLQIEMKMFFFTVSLLIINPFTKVINKIHFKEYTNYYLLGMISFVSIVYMLFTAPDFRFSEVYIWIFFATVISFYSNYLMNQNKGFKIVVVFAAIYLAFSVSWPIWLDSKPIWRSVRWDPTFPVEKTLVIPSDGSPPFNIFKPTDNGFCGNSELPCTPDEAVFNGKTKELVPGDISKGFAPVD
jgi:hypothetical protein